MKVHAAALPDMGEVKGILFDIDGTLCDSDPLHLAVFQDLLEEEGFRGGERIDHAFFNEHIAGRHNPEIARDLFPDWTEEARVAFYTRKEAEFRRRAVAGGLAPVEGLGDFLRWVEGSGIKRIAVTNAPRENAEVMLRALGLEGFFAGVVLGEACARAKPHPDPYLEGMRRLGVSAGEAVALEDSPSGMRAAVAAGLPCFGVLTGQTEETLVRAGAVATVRDYRELMALVGIGEAPAAGQSA